MTIYQAINELCVAELYHKHQDEAFNQPLFT